MSITVQENRVPPGPHSGVEAKPGAGAGQEAEKALSLSPHHLRGTPAYCRKCTPAGFGCCRCEIACNE